MIFNILRGIFSIIGVLAVALFLMICFNDFLSNLDVGIDWTATSTIEDSEEREFLGTFDDVRNVPVLRGEIFLNNGKNYFWMANLEIKLSGLSEVLALIKKYDSLSDNEIQEKLEHKLRFALEESEKDAYNLNYVLNCGHNYKDAWR